MNCNLKSNERAIRKFCYCLKDKYLPLRSYRAFNKLAKIIQEGKKSLFNK